MRSVALKFVAFILAAACLVCAAGSLLGVGVLGYQGLYDRDLETLTGTTLDKQSQNLAQQCLMLYASYTLGQCPEELLLGLYGDVYTSAQENWSVTICQDEQEVASINGSPENPLSFTYSIQVEYLSINPSEEGTDNAVHMSVPKDGRTEDYLLYQCTSPEYTVTVQISPKLVG